MAATSLDGSRARRKVRRTSEKALEMKVKAAREESRAVPLYIVECFLQ